MKPIWAGTLLLALGSAAAWVAWCDADLAQAWVGLLSFC